MVYAVAEHFHDVEPHCDIVAPRLHEEIFRNAYVPLFFAAADRLRRRSVSVRKARFHFAEDDGACVFRNDIRLSERRRIIGLQDLIAELSEEVQRPFFPCPSQNFFVKVLR